ncbi:MAG: hypothetical protein WD490_07320 [Opitutales bacterium]
MTHFRYVGDALCCVSCVLYGLNRWILKPQVPVGFFHTHFNDLLLIPCALPLMLLLHRKLGLRLHDGPPTAGEIALHFAVWSILMEVLGPRWIMHATADPRDILAYAVGAIAAGLWWNRTRLPVLRTA